MIYIPSITSDCCRLDDYVSLHYLLKHMAHLVPLGSGVQYESRVSLGYLNQSFQNAVMDGIRYGLEQGLCGWNVTDCKICFEYGLYYSPVSTPADFRSLAPIVLEQALKESGTQLLEGKQIFSDTGKADDGGAGKATGKSGKSTAYPLLFQEVRTLL